ncbi:MAG: hypothetical protein AB7V04_05940 [Desulfomonilaceae bacterium]
MIEFTISGWKEIAPTIRTVWVMFAFIPIMLISALICTAILILATPLTVYAFVTNKHLKSPWARSHQQI